MRNDDNTAAVDSGHGNDLAAADNREKFLRNTMKSCLSMGRDLLERLMLVAADVAGIGLAFYTGLELDDLARLAGTPPVLVLWMQEDTPSHFVAFFTAVALMLFWLWNGGHYARRFPFWEELGRLLKILLTGLFTEIGLLVLLSDAPVDWVQVSVTWLLVFLLLPMARMGMKRLLIAIGLWRRKTIIVGLGANAQTACEALLEEPLMGYDLRWFGRSPGDLPLKGDTVDVGSSRLPIVDLTHDPEGELARLGKPQLIVALDQVAGNEDFIQRMAVLGHDTMVAPSIRGLPLYGTEVMCYFRHEVVMLRMQNNLENWSARTLKRLFDVIGASILLVFLGPLLLFLSFRIWREDGLPVVFSQLRIGRDGRVFSFFKFRSMVRNADAVLNSWEQTHPERWLSYRANNFKLKEDPRVLPSGSWMRASSMDELPQLWNVLKGDMSLVGPRPILERELGPYGQAIDAYNSVRPGITGLWQVSGRSQTSFADRVALDGWYIRNWSLWIDIVILLKTVRVVLFRKGAY